MKRPKINPRIIYVIGLITLLVAACVSMLQPDLIGIPLIISATLLATLCICLLATVAILNLRSRNPKSDNYDRGPAAKVLGVLLLVALLVSVVTAVKSVWLEPSYAKFAYENTAAATGFGAILFILILSAVQRDVYWVTRKKTLLLDERQIKERQQVFETSYKLGAFAILAIAWIGAKTLHNVPMIISTNANSIPGQLLWLPFAAAITLFALPLVVAAWRK